MTRRHVTSLINFHALFIIPFGALLCLLAFCYGCQKAEEPKRDSTPSITTENLQTAYGKSARRVKMYSLFVDQAEKEHNKNMARLYRAISRSEAIHARNHAGLLKKQGIEAVAPADEPVVVGTIVQTLKMALSSEEMEYDAMYPNLIRSADAEKFTEASVQFSRTRDADTRHGELVREAADKAGKIAPTDYFVCPECGYVITSGKTEECPVCQTKKGLFENI